eukprot:TRINITY_DN6344_c0_g1_i1.p1 TRINITY_DN6344_c0_g1~~TRINITY_DN6344_c0_g1_i1.p1  ORF type:complete len:112 (-),score=14.22 TRINITY_DN6344_c0_g1_i1:76-411(-)
MGRLFICYLVGNQVWSCANCHIHFANNEDIISKQFTGRHGKAYLFSTVVNFSLGKREDRQLLTGLHTVVDIHCIQCYSYVGWKYEVAFEESQKYKEGKFIMEKAVMYKADS